MLTMLPSKTPNEAKVITWDFTNVATGTLSSPSITKSTIVGSDPSAAGLSVTSPIVSGSTVYTLVSNGLDNCSYELLCTVSDSSGQVHQDGAAITTTTDAA